MNKPRIIYDSMVHCPAMATNKGRTFTTAICVAGPRDAMACDPAWDHILCYGKFIDLPQEPGLYVCKVEQRTGTGPHNEYLECYFVVEAKKVELEQLE